MHIPMTDLRNQYNSLKPEINSAIQRVLESGRFILGPEVENFENEMAAYCNTRYAIGVASGTDALLLGLIACGIKPNDEVITTPFTFIATAEAITHCGAVPVFADIDPRSYNIDPDQIRKRLSNKTRAIIPVHLYGQPADMDAILDISHRFHLKVIEDCAQALGAEYKSRKVGSLGDVGCFSFFPSKNLGAYGDAGLIVTNDSKVADSARLLRQHGANIVYYHLLPGFNSRLDAIQAAILRVKLKYLDGWTSLRRQKAFLYTQLLQEIENIIPPNTAEYATISANYYTVRINNGINRTELRHYLLEKNIETMIYYPLSLHLQNAYKHLGYHYGDFPESEKAQEQVLSFPLYPEIDDQRVYSVINGLKDYLGENQA